MPGNFGVQDSDTDGPPSQMLEVIHEAIQSNADDDVLEGLGLGNYGEQEHWQQVESFKDGMYAHSAFASRLIDRSIEETIVDLGLTGHAWYDDQDEEPRNEEGWEDLSEQQRREKFDEERITRREYVLQRGEEIWSKLTDEQKLEAIEEATGSKPGWTPPFWRMMQARHESSRSRDARLLDNVFGTRDQQKIEGSGLDDASSILGGGN